MDSEERRMEQDEEGQPPAEALVETSDPAEAAPLPASEPAAQEADSSQVNGEDSTALEALKPGMRLKGVVRNVVDFGAFVDIGVGRDGLVHVSSLKNAGIDQGLKVGDALDVVVRRVNVEENRISLTVPGAERSPKVRLQDLKVNSIVEGKVVRLADFGAFVDLGAQTDGLIHISELQSGYVKHPSEVLQVGDDVQVRILNVDARKRRISLSMKDLEADAESDEMQEAAPEESPGERLPTAFEMAFERARVDQRRRQRQARR